MKSCSQRHSLLTLGDNNKSSFLSLLAVVGSVKARRGFKETFEDEATTFDGECKAKKAKQTSREHRSFSDIIIICAYDMNEI